jgi:hypothetical protein
MPKERKKNSPLQNWKKGIAIFLWHWLILTSFAQTLPQLPEISTHDGLPTASTRRILELPSGSVLVATDGGLHYSPKNQPALTRITDLIGAQQCWDLQLVGNTLFVATYNNGLYQFDIERGNLIKHHFHPNFKKIRRLRFVQGRLFCIAHYGVFEVQGNRLILRMKSDQHLPTDNMPMDVFIREGLLHVLSYPEQDIIMRNAKGNWVSWKNHLKSKGVEIPPGGFDNLTAFQTDSTLVLGGVNRYSILDHQNHWQYYHFLPNHSESWAIWDFQLHRNQLFAAVSNTNDFNDGFLHTHHPNIHNYNPPHSQSLWSITPSKFRDALWMSTETDGAHLLIQPSQNDFSPIDYNTRIMATAHYTIECHAGFINIQKYPHSANNNVESKFRHIQCDDRIRAVVETNGDLFFLGAKKLWHYNSAKSGITSLINTEAYQWIEERNGILWLFKPYNNVWTFDPKTSKLTDMKYEAKSDCVRKSNGLFFYHIMGKGFAFIDEKGRQYTLQSDKPITQYTLNFEVVNNQLLIENGSTFDAYQIDLKNHQLHYLRTINLTSSFRDFQVIQTLSDGKYLTLYSGQYLVQLDLTNNFNSIAIRQQLYLGRWRNQGPAIQIGDRFVIDRGNVIQSVSFENNPTPQFDVQYSYQEEPSLFLRPYFAINTEKNFRITVAGTQYFDLLRSLYEVELTNVSTGNKQNNFFRGDAYYWINGIGEGKFHLAVSLSNQWKSQFIIGTNNFYRDFPFWLMLLSILTLLYWVFINQVRTQESQQKRIATLQLKTLQSNFNPHFIYNSMSLIQSLIIGSETKKAIDVTARLAKLNRRFLTNSNKELIVLKDELDFVKEYVEMEKLRFESDTNFSFSISINAKVRVNEWLIPPLILQPLVENAIKHGALISKQKAEVKIIIQLEDPLVLQIVILNSLSQGKRRSVYGMGLGNQLVSDRLDIFNELYPNQYRADFSFGPNDQNQYQASIKICKLATQPKTSIFEKIGGG